jgi:hypothetical protein
MITTLPERIAALPPADRARCEHLFFVQRTEGRAVIPAAMESWVTASFGAIERVRHQTIVRVVNRFTLEGTLFNPLRALRPAGAMVSDEELHAWIAAELNISTSLRNHSMRPAPTFLDASVVASASARRTSPNMTAGTGW